MKPIGSFTDLRVVSTQLLTLDSMTPARDWAYPMWTNRLGIDWGRVAMHLQLRIMFPDLTSDDLALEMGRFLITLDQLAAKVPTDSGEPFELGIEAAWKFNFVSRRKHYSATHLIEDGSLTFAEFSTANVTRADVAYGHGHASDWGIAEWSMATLGEIGELANILKKRRRGDSIGDTPIGEEFGDIVAYLFLLADAVHVDLGRAVAAAAEVELTRGTPSSVDA